MGGNRGIAIVLLVSMAIAWTITGSTLAEAEPKPAPRSAAQPSTSGDDWAPAYLEEDPLAAKEDITYDELVQALQNPQLRELAIPRHLARAKDLSDEQQESLLRAALANDSPVVRRQAAAELQRQGLLEQVVRDLLLELTRSDDPGLRRAAIVALERIPLPQPPEDYWQALIETLGDDDFTVSDAAARQLRELGPEAVPALLEALKGESGAVRQRAAGLLGDIVGSKERLPPATGGPAVPMVPRAPEATMKSFPPAAAPPPKGPGADGGLQEHRTRQVDDKALKLVRVYFGTNREMSQAVLPSLWSRIAAFALLVGVLLGYSVVTWRRGKEARQKGETPRRRFSLVLITAMVTVACWAGAELNSAVQQCWAQGTGPKFGPRRSTGGTVYYGHCDVSLPPTHELGEVERPLIGPEVETQHVVLQRTALLDAQAFYEAVQRELAGRQVDARDCFVFVHGFNVSFDDAARRTAQIHHDLQFPGVPMFYSWPSRGGLRHYPSDRNEIGYSKEHVKQFLVGVADNIQARRIHIIAHSMGGAAVTQAIAELEREDVIFDQIVLAAPDIDADVFREQLMPKLVRHGRRTTLYCSQNDLALHVSYAFNDFPRAGDSSRGVVVAQDLDTVDASGIDTDLLGHSYYGDAVRLLDDVALLLQQNLPPTSPKRHLRPLSAIQGAVYWIFGD